MRSAGPNRAARNLSSIARLLPAGGAASSRAAASFSSVALASPTTLMELAKSRLISPGSMSIRTTCAVVRDLRGCESRAEGEEHVVMGEVGAEIVDAGFQRSDAEADAAAAGGPRSYAAPNAFRNSPAASSMAAPVRPSGSPALKKACIVPSYRVRRVGTPAERRRSA